MSLPVGDKSRSVIEYPEISSKEKIKMMLRRLIYPGLNHMMDKKLEKEYPFKATLGCDKIMLGQRGNDYDSHRRRLEKTKSIEGATVLIVGVGTGYDLDSWIKYKPKKIIGVDYFDYSKTWNALTEYFKQRSDTELEFYQADMTDMHMFEENSADIIGSDAVFEHVNQFGPSVKEMYRVLKKDGVLYATFGPLWYSWGGDHISGRDDLKNGYNHIKLAEPEYHTYLDSFGEHQHDSHDGRTWLYNDLFSRLKPIQYIDQLEGAGFKKEYLSVLLEHRALEFSERYPDEFCKLRELHELEDLIITGMTTIYRK
jgi:ubiquinone/menaquinone biosynthesis C-methylase UbiE